MTMTPSMCVIGNGCAAVEVCRGLRESGYRGEIDVFAEGTLPVYNPMLTSYYAAGKIDYPLLFPYGNSNAIFEKFNVTLHPGSPVTALSAASATLVVNGRERSFDKCCVAAGASAIIPPIPGARLPGVFTMRTVEDALAVKNAMKKNPRRALVVGASMVGIKLVELFWKAGMQVVLGDLADRIFPLAAHPECSMVIESRLQDKGIELRFSSALERIEENGCGLSAFFKGTSAPIDVDMIILAIGVRANIGFIDREEVDAAQGVLVDSRMRSNAPEIYAAGDCAQGMNLLSGQQQIIGLWANARNQGYTAGCNMAGAPREYVGEILHNITHFMGMDFVGIGDISDENEYTIKNERKVFKQIFYKDGRICGANFLDFYNESGIFKNILIKQLLRRNDMGSSTADNPLQPLQEYLLNVECLTEPVNCIL